MNPKEYSQMMAYLTRPAMARGGRIGFDNGGDAVKLKALQADYDKFGKKELNKAAKVLGFEDYSSMMGEKNRNKRNKIKKELTEFGEVMTEAGSRQRSRVGRIQTEQDIQIKLPTQAPTPMPTYRLSSSSSSSSLLLLSLSLCSLSSLSLSLSSRLSS